MSFYTLRDILGVPALEDAISCPFTLDPLIAQFLKALPLILEDRPLETTGCRGEEGDGCLSRGAK